MGNPNRASRLEFTPLEHDPIRLIPNKRGIRIAFSRYGLVKEGTCENEQYQYGDFSIPQKALFPENAPAIPKYSYCRKLVRDGYLYVYNETWSQEEGKDLWYEYKIRDGKLFTIVWEDLNSNKRESQTGAWRDTNILVRANDVVWVAYSDTQWSASYTKHNITSKSCRFQKIDTGEWLQILDPDEQAVAPNLKGSMLQTITNQKTDSSGKKTELDFMLTRGEFDKLATLHLTLHDPIGAAEDICVDASNAYEQLRLLVTSIQTGTENPETLSESVLKQAQALYTHGLMFNKIFYDQRNGQNNSGTEEEKKAHQKFLDMKKHIVSKDFLEKMLGKDERAKLREEIDKYRESLLTFISNDYYNNVLDDYRENTPFRRELGIITVLKHIQQFAYDPSLADRAMDNADTISPVTKTVKQFLEKVFDDTTHPINRLLAKELDLQDMIDDYDSQQTNSSKKLGNIDSNNIFYEDFVAQVDLVWANMFTVFIVWQEYIKKLPKTQKYITEVPSKWFDVTIRSQSIAGGKKQYLWAINNSLELEEELRKINASLPEGHPVRLRGRGAGGRSGIPAASEQQILLAATKNKKLAGIEFNPKIEVLKNPTAQKFTLLAKVFNSKGFLCFSGMLSIGNLMVAVNDDRDGRNPLTIAGSAIAITAAVTEIAYYCVYYAEVHHQVQLTILGRIRIPSSSLSGVAITAAGVAGIIQGISSIGKGDVDAGIAYIAGGAFLITGWILSVTITVAWPATVAYAIAVGLLILAVYLTDTPIEEFFKNCILRKKAIDVMSNWNSLTAKEIHAQLLARKTDIVNTTYFKEWLDMETSIKQLMEFFAAVKIDTEKSTLGSVSGNIYIETTLIDRVTVCLNPSRLTFNTPLKGGLWVYTNDKEVIKMWIDDTATKQREKGFRVTHQETEEGAKIVFDLQNNTRIARVYFFYHLELSDGTVFPSFNTNEYFIQMVHRQSSRRIDIPVFLVNLLGSVLDYSEYCNKKDRKIYSLEKFETLIKIPL